MAGSFLTQSIEQMKSDKSSAKIMVWSLKFLQKTICSLSINNTTQSKYINVLVSRDLNLRNGIEKNREFDNLKQWI